MKVLNLDKIISEDKLIKFCGYDIIIPGDLSVKHMTEMMKQMFGNMAASGDDTE